MILHARFLCLPVEKERITIRVTQMTESIYKTLETYRQAFNDMIGEILSTRSQALWKLLRLNKEEDSTSLWTAFYIIGDSSLAIQDFTSGGAGTYLRLYGLLNAVYIQQNAMLRLFKLMNLRDLKSATNLVKGLQIRRLRHKLGAHSLDFREDKLGNSGGKNINKLRKDATHCFVLARSRMEPFSCEFLNNTTLAYERVNLRDEVDEHTKVMTHLFALIYEKAGTTAFKGNEKMLRKHAQRSAELRSLHSNPPNRTGN